VVKHIVLTGGAGFIGSHVAEHFFHAYPQAQLTIIDKMTYAADIDNLRSIIQDPRVRLAVGDICDYAFVSRYIAEADLVIHAAAESHVDNSFGNSLPFTMTNVYGTHVILEACRLHKTPRIIHVSTDEVYGEVLEGANDESAPMNPTNPYSASKAGAEMILRGFLNCYRMPIVIVRANNIFGIRQFPEKIIPKFSLLLHKGMKLTIHGDGSNRRHFLAAQDFAEALQLLVEKGVIGEAYNIGSEDEFTNNEVAAMLCAQFGYDPKDWVTYVEDRPFNDRRYALHFEKIKALGWRQNRSITNMISDVVQWYRDHADRYEYYLRSPEFLGLKK